jgi:hypothetical protein
LNQSSSRSVGSVFILRQDLDLEMGLMPPFQIVHAMSIKEILNINILLKVTSLTNYPT